MTPSKKGLKYLAELKDKLPQYCVIRKRKSYYVVYFSVPKKLRPEGWKAIYEVGRTDRSTQQEIIKRGLELYEDLKNSRRKEDRHEPRVTTGSLAWLIARYKKSEHYLNLKPATQKGYEHYLKTLRKWSDGSKHAHIRMLTAPVIHEFLDQWKSTPRTRKYLKDILSKLYQVAIEQNCVKHNFVKELKLPKTAKKRVPFKVWKIKDIETFAEKADEMGLPNAGTAVIIAWEAFRQTDVFSIQEPRDYKNGVFRFYTSKTDQLVTVRASQRTIKRLEKRPKTQLLLTVNDLTKHQWTKNSFYNQFRKVCEACGLDGYVFRRIRNSAAINALKADLTDAEFQQRFGWSKKDVKAMIAHYTDIDQDIIDSGAKKLERLDKS